MSRPNPWVASLLSALLPGAGHMYAGDRDRGFRLVAIDVVLIVFFGISLLFFQTEVLKVWASLPSLSLVMVGNLVLLSYRGWAAYDAYQMVSGSSSATSKGVAVVLGVVLWLVVLMPHAAVGYYNIVQYSLISEVFAAPPATATAIVTTARA